MTAAAVTLLAGLMGVAGLFSGFDDVLDWGLLALATALLCVAATVLHPWPRLGREAVVALAGGAALLAWSTLSMTWAESIDQAWREAARIGFYALVVTLVVITVRSGRDSARVVGALTAGLALFTVYTGLALFSGDAPSMFREFRLEDPLGYINGMAGLLVMALWAFFAVADSGAAVWLRAAAVAAAVLALDLVVLTQSRAAVPALAAGAVLVLAVFPDRIRRGWLLVLVFGACAGALPELIDVYDKFDGERELPTRDSIRGAAVAAWLSALAAGAAALVLLRRPRKTPSPTAARLAVAALVAVPVVAVVVATVAVGNPVEKARDQYDAFTSLEVAEDQSTRLASGGGFRYDLWKIGLRQFERHPLRGVGAGNYDTTYYRERENPQPAPNPHSLEVQVLGELGLIGFGGLLAFVGGTLAAVWRVRSRPASERWAYMSAGAVFVAWLVHTSFDWLHTIAGVTGVALVAGATLLARAAGGTVARGASIRDRWRPAVVGLVAVTALLAAGIGRLYASDWYRARGGERLPQSPAAALRDAERSLDLNPESLEAHYLAAAAEARLARYPAARSTLLRAAEKEPSDYVPWVLLGDLALRAGFRGDARHAYARAEVLNPFDTNFTLDETEERIAGG